MKKKTKQIWMAWEWPGFYWYQGIHPIYAWFYDFKKYGCSVNHVVATFSKGTEAYYFVRTEYLKAGEKFFRKVKQKPNIIFSVLGKINTAAENIFKLGQLWQSVNFSKLTNQQLLQYHKILFKWDQKLWRNGQIPNLLELSNNLLTQYVKSLIETRLGKGKVNDIFTVITTSNYYTKTELQDRDFLNLLKVGHPNQDKLKQHWKKYTWMTYGWSGPALTYEYFSQNFKQASKTSKNISVLEKNINHKQAVLKQQKTVLNKFPEQDRIFLKMLRQILEFKAKRVDAHSLTYFYAEKIMLEIGKRVGLSLNQMRVIIPSDVPKLFKSVNVDQINREYNRVLIWYKKPNAKKYTGQAAEKRLAYIKKHLPKLPKTNELKGELAHPGKVIGRVKIILDIKDASKFQKGEILITRMTDPSYISIMKISKAIITDIGGITCHAAIVSRELRKPCIVGTQFATKIFKDGDLVEVDANKGIIRKL